MVGRIQFGSVSPSDISLGLGTGGVADLERIITVSCDSFVD